MSTLDEADWKNERLAVQVWDSNGRPDCLEFHRLFLTRRSIILVVWKLAQPLGCQRPASLVCHPGQTPMFVASATPEENQVSLVVVGTHLAASKMDPLHKGLRADQHGG